MEKQWIFFMGGLLILAGSFLLTVSRPSATLFAPHLLIELPPSPPPGQSPAATTHPTPSLTPTGATRTPTPDPGTPVTTPTVFASVTQSVTPSPDVPPSATSSTPDSSPTLPATVVPSPTYTASAMPTPTPPATSSPTVTATVTPTFTATSTPTITSTPTPAETATPTATATPTPTPTPNPSAQIVIGAGLFLMGCPEGEYCEFDSTLDRPYPEERPLHPVMLGAYRIDRHEVTNARYAACVNAGHCTPPATIKSATRTHYYINSEFADYPVIHVSWSQAHAFCTWEGKRLPTEAEWERAARGALDTREFPTGNDAPDCNQANLNKFPAPCVGDTTRIGSYPAGASPDGVHDMAGNVSEWVADWYDPAYYATSPDTNPAGPATGELRVYRGGSWADMQRELRVSRRRAADPDHTAPDLGFRCVAPP